MTERDAQLRRAHYAACSAWRLLQHARDTGAPPAHQRELERIWLDAEHRLIDLLEAPVLVLAR